MDDVAVDDTIIKVVEPDNITVDTYIDLDGEEVYVKSVGTDSITVSRGQDGTTITTHLNGAEIKSITAADADLIPDGDDFGFSGAFG
jgi:hypothetical protein